MDLKGGFMGLKMLTIITVYLVNIAFAHVSVDAQRIVFDRSKATSKSVVIRNHDVTKPYLAQIWIEDELENRVDFPIVALPFLQRIEAKGSHQVRISSIGDESSLAKDRETLFYFNLLGVPPKTDVDADAMVQMFFQYHIKLFYRPAGLQVYKRDNGWINDAKIQRENQQITIENPTPYYLSIAGYADGGGHKDTRNFISEELLIKPYSVARMKAEVGRVFTILYATDIGKETLREYSCHENNNSCQLNLAK